MAKRSKWSVFAIASLFFCMFVFHAFARYTTFHNQTFDLAFYARMAWGTVHGSFWDPIINAHFVGLHLSLLMVPLGLLGAMFGTVQVLLIAQSMAVCAVCWPLSKLGARRFGEKGAVIAPIIWLLYPNIGHVATYEFHPGTVATFPLACALECLSRNRGKNLAFWVLVMVACRADLAFIAGLLGLFTVYKANALRRTGWMIAGLSFFYLAVFILIIHPAFAPVQGSLQAHFSKWGDTVPEIVATLLSSPQELLNHLMETKRVTYIPALLAPVLFLPLLCPSWLLLALPPLSINLLSDFPTTTHLDCHYQTIMVPVIIIATIDGMGRLKEGRIRQVIGLSLVLCSGLANFLSGGLPWSLDYPKLDFREDALSASGRRVVQRIPKHASVQAPDRLLPHLAERLDLFRAPPPERMADFLVLDIRHRQRYAHKEVLIRTIEEPLIRDWLARSDHALIHAETDLLVFQRGKSPRDGLASRYFVGTSPIQEKSVAITSCLSAPDAQLHERKLCLYFTALDSCPSDLVIRLGVEPKSRRVDLLFDGLLSPSQLRPADRVRSCHLLSSSEKRAILRRGLYVGAIRQSGARPLPTDPTSIRIKVHYR